MKYIKHAFLSIFIVMLTFFSFDLSVNILDTTNETKIEIVLEEAEEAEEKLDEKLYVNLNIFQNSILPKDVLLDDDNNGKNQILITDIFEPPRNS